MGTWFVLYRCLHIAAGCTGSFVAPVALAARKGGVAHRLSGGTSGCATRALPCDQALIYPAHQRRPFVDKAGVELNQ